MEIVRDMRNPEKVLNSLCRHSSDLTYKFERLYRILFNEEMYCVAYKRIYAKPGNMTKGVDGKTVDGFSMSKIKQLIDTLKDETYQPYPSQRTYIPKKNGKMRPLGIPSFIDKLLQEVIRMILEAMYEGSFEKSSHGFRPERSCHTALKSFQKSGNGTKWFIEGDIKGFFDNINHEVLINILMERIADDRFIRLIRKFLNAGYVEDWVFHKTYGGTPQGGIISPILANIYLDKFDKYMTEYIAKFDKGNRRKENPIAKRLGHRKAKLASKLKNVKNKTERKRLKERIREIVKERLKYPAGDEMDSSMKRLKYVRYADDFLMGVIGSKEDCKRIKDDIKKYLYDTLKLELSEEKTLITNARKSAKFLGYDIFVRKSDETHRDKNGHLTRSYDHKIVLYVTTEVIRKKLFAYDAMKIVKRNGKEVWKPKGRNYMRNSDDLEIISQYNSEIMGFYNYYSIANNSCVIDSFYNIMEYGMYKTYAGKYRTSKKKIIAKYKKNGVFAIPYKNKRGYTFYREFYDKGFKRKEMPDVNLNDRLPNTIAITGGRNGLITRLQAGVCELCGSTDELEMHHVRKLKNLKGKSDWEVKMIARKRKTLAVCIKCHHKIHAGRID
jgi:group II intron reverse transcriptase/maturase